MSGSLNYSIHTQTNRPLEAYLLLLSPQLLAWSDMPFHSSSTDIRTHYQRRDRIIDSVSDSWRVVREPASLFFLVYDRHTLRSSNASYFLLYHVIYFPRCHCHEDTTFCRKLYRGYVSLVKNESVTPQQNSNCWTVNCAFVDFILFFIFFFNCKTRQNYRNVLTTKVIVPTCYTVEAFNLRWADDIPTSRKSVEELESV